jgi:hypothetical protein
MVSQVRYKRIAARLFCITSLELIPLQFNAIERHARRNTTHITLQETFPYG